MTLEELNDLLTAYGEAYASYQANQGWHDNTDKENQETMNDIYHELADLVQEVNG